MAKRVQTLLIDDIDGGDATQTIVFGLDGTSYEIDLSDANAQKMRDDLKKYVESGRRPGKGQPVRGGRRSGAQAGSEDTAAVRAWAKENGHSVNDRGRVPAEIRAAYEKAKAA